MIVRYAILGKSRMISHCALVLSHQDPKCIIETMKIFHRDLLRVLLFLLYVTPSTIAPPCQGSSKQGISAPLVALNQSAFDRFQKGDVGDKAGNLLYEPQFDVALT